MIVNGYEIRLGADLQDADLQDADLWGANLWGAKLQGANLWGANLRVADLQDANLQGADLRRADFQDANLWRANLRGADLRLANLQNANLRGAKGFILLPVQDSRGYSFPHAVQSLNGVWMIRAGCRYLSIAKAKEHWGKAYEGDREQGDMYLHAIEWLEKKLEREA